MKRTHASGLLFLSFLLAGPLLAQTSIGSGTCNSSSLNGAYAVTLAGRQVTGTGNFATVAQANGLATFDGQNKVSITLTVDALPLVAIPVAWSGTYSIQANCAGTVTITIGGTTTLNLVVYNRGNNFLVSGTDSTYSYSGSGNVRPSAACSAGTFAGVYTFSSTGYALSAGAVSGVSNGTGLLQFDGQGHVTVNANISASGGVTNALTLTGSYTVSSTCLASATLTDSSSGSYVMTFSVYTGTAVSSADFFVTLAQNSKLLLSGSAHAVYGQPTATAQQFRNGTDLSAKLLPGSILWGGRA